MQRRTTGSEALTGLILEVFQLNGRLLNAGDALTRPLGQTSARWQVLGALDGDARTVAEIARWMGLTRQSVQRLADLLAADGLLSYADNPAHRRAKLAMLTPRGRTVLAAITARQIEWANGIARRVAEDDVRRAIGTLQQVRASVDGAPLPRRKAGVSSPRRATGPTAPKAAPKAARRSAS